MSLPLPSAETFQSWSSQDLSLWLTKLARMFREQSSLFLQQAQLLERMVVECDEGDEHSLELLLPNSRETLEETLRRRNVVSHVSTAYDLMLDTHEKLDCIESRLVPWGEKGKAKKRKRHNAGAGSAFVMYVNEHYQHFAEIAGSRKVQLVTKEAAKAWKNLEPSEKSPYVEKSEMAKRAKTHS